jgi:signal transduction histidine kinase
LKQQAELARVESEKRMQQEFSKQLIATQEAERKRVASGLHDSLGQQLLIVNNELQLNKTSTERKDEDIDRAVSTVKDAIKEVRAIASNLHPHQMEKLGFRAAVGSMIETVGHASSIEFIKEIEDVGDVVSKEQQINVYRVLQEALANAVRHSGATSVSVVLARVGDEVQMSVRDNGKGFAPGASSDGRQGFGMKMMQERVRMCVGTLTVDSVEGKGTTLSMVIPIR